MPSSSALEKSHYVNNNHILREVIVFVAPVQSYLRTSIKTRSSKLTTALDKTARVFERAYRRLK